MIKIYILFHMKKRGEDLKYKQIKWLILTIPTVTIALWEYIRHEFLLSYITMEIGNFFLQY